MTSSQGSDRGMSPERGYLTRRVFQISSKYLQLALDFERCFYQHTIYRPFQGTLVTIVLPQPGHSYREVGLHCLQAHADSTYHPALVPRETAY